MTTDPHIDGARRLYSAGYSVRQVAGRLGIPKADVESWRKAKLPDGEKWERTRRGKRVARRKVGASKRHTDVRKTLDKLRRDLEETFAKIRAGDDGTVDLCKLLDAHATSLLAYKDGEGKTRITTLDPDNLSRVSSVIAQAQHMKRTAARAPLAEAKELATHRAQAEKVKVNLNLDKDDLDELSNEELDKVIKGGVLPPRKRPDKHGAATEDPASAGGSAADTP